MLVNEIFYSINGEGKLQGKSAVFVRFSGCNLNCKYCDTKYAQTKEEGKEMSVDEIVEEIKKYNCPRVTLTGGEPLLQKDIYELVRILAYMQFTIDIETNGSILLQSLPLEAFYTMDIKCPCSGNEKYFEHRNLRRLTDRDEVKFVVCDEKDLEYSLKYLNDIDCTVIYSPVFGCDMKVIAEFVKNLRKDNIKISYQLHKLIWAPNKRGV